MTRVLCCFHLGFNIVVSISFSSPESWSGIQHWSFTLKKWVFQSFAVSFLQTLPRGFSFRSIGQKSRQTGLCSLLKVSQGCIQVLVGTRLLAAEAKSICRLLQIAGWVQFLWLQDRSFHSLGCRLGPLSSFRGISPHVAAPIWNQPWCLKSSCFESLTSADSLRKLRAHMIWLAVPR